MWSRPRSAHPGTSFSRRRRSPRRRHAEAYIDPPAPALYLVTLVSAALPCPVFCCVSSSSSSVAACPELPSSLAPERLSVRLCAPTKSTRRMVSAPKNDYEVGKRRSHTELQAETSERENVQHSVCKLAPEAATLSHVILSDPPWGYLGQHVEHMPLCSSEMKILINAWHCTYMGILRSE